jgi:hypothetical protein
MQVIKNLLGLAVSLDRNRILDHAVPRAFDEYQSWWLRPYIWCGAIGTLESQIHGKGNRRTGELFLSPDSSRCRLGRTACPVICQKGSANRMKHFSTVQFFLFSRPYRLARVPVTNHPGWHIMKDAGARPYY